MKTTNEKFTSVIGEYETFNKEVIKLGDSMAITIPANVVAFSGVKEGDWIKVMFKIIKREVDTNDNKGVNK